MYKQTSWGGSVCVADKRWNESAFDIRSKPMYVLQWFCQLPELDSLVKVPVMQDDITKTVQCIICQSVKLFLLLCLFIKR